MSFRKRIAFYLEDIDTPTGKALNLLITGLVLLSVAIFVAQTYPLSEEWRTVLGALDLALLLLFSLEYLLRLWCAEDRLKFVFSLFGLIDLMAILPFFLGAVDIRFIRIFRWFRILRLARFFEGRTVFGYVTTEDSAIVARILFTLFSIVFVYSGLIYQVEHPVNPEQFNTFFDAIYFSISTISTAGLGDVVPITDGGRSLTILMLLTGILFIPWQLGDLIKQLVKTGTRVAVQCSNCDLSVHDPDALFCKNCGTRLPAKPAFFPGESDTNPTQVENVIK
ncbi:ion transporter [Thermoleptolyngbya oregonensis NK1-22]|uniref:Ion transporter n=1 Tax=Thermoleptolyngbya oregonensis NK1-22 TaxID=2547457 RepID=A0AA97BDH1_9CYAN|nr:ion transporter [Thermoleptolyngbya sp. M55_K2018_002]WOB44334.1 ion transporter [Thermoleptolyngbya oregonensis NK1-22]HIK42210.1 ion transporter [Thermoleptolyngbya sp. M55_K2018_002]